MSDNLVNLSAVMAFAIPSPVIWSYLAFGLALAVGLITVFLRGDWQKARGLDRGSAITSGSPCLDLLPLNLRFSSLARPLE
jgi:hypothetical protein